MPISRLRPVLLVLACALAAPAAAAAKPASGTIQLSSSSYTVGEADGAAVITVTRTTASGSSSVRYGVWYARSATPQTEYKPVSGRLDFAPGETTATFRIPIFDDDDVEGPETVKLGIYGAHPQRLGTPTRATLTIVDDDVVDAVRDAANPLALDPPPPGSNPLQGARFFVDEEWGIANRVAQQLKRRSPETARRLRVIGNQPETKRFGRWNDKPGKAIAQYLQRTRHADPDAVPLVATYRLRHLRCGNVSDTPKQAAAYKRWYEAFARGIGNHRVVVFFEIDALITAKCLSKRGRAVRVDELRSAIDALAAVPHAVVYVDAGSGLAHSPRFIAKLLRQIRVAKIQGFFTNATHQNWTSREIAYGRKLIRRLGGKPHHVVNTATNGRGPLVPHDRVRYGNSFRCNAPGRGLGPRPTADVPSRFRNLDGFFWIGNPGRSAGACSKTPNPPPTGSFWVDYALSLIRNADFRIR